MQGFHDQPSDLNVNFNCVNTVQYDVQGAGHVARVGGRKWCTDVLNEESYLKAPHLKFRKCD